MKQEMRLEMSFYRKGKLVGGSFCVFTGTEEEIRGVLDENGKLDEELIEFMAHRAGVRRYGVSTSAYEIVNVTDDEADDSAEE